jgi:hypothetical protein
MAKSYPASRLPSRPEQAGYSWVPFAPKPTDEANRCILGHLTPKTLQKALYVGSSQTSRPLQVVCLGWSQFPFPEAPLAGQAGPIYGLTPCMPVPEDKLEAPLLAV